MVGRPYPFKRAVTIRAVERPAQVTVERPTPGAEVRLWRVDLDTGVEDEAELIGTLSADELARAERLARPEARRRFVVARGMLRRLLGEALGESPESISIAEDVLGKPRLAGGERRLGFNVSHCGDLALICISAGGEVGVDLEALRPVPSAVEIARRRFSAAEARYVEQGRRTSSDNGRPSEVDRRFLRCWTRKEAIVKAIGAGLDFDLRGFSVPLGATGGIVELDDSEGGEPQGWLLVDVPLGPGHVGALALTASPRRGKRARKIDR